ncbi:hypothetical protein KVV02_002043 [Mortierella alpina]|uniref:T-box domain-containing protein n=1 Tax=Mortierella alpina TaxID=64518 RepID=A0A9P8A758_MORAP|nr:hypothetical protein KVV02_002043 [Mortierella alpina]
MPQHWQDDTAGSYTISTRVPCEDATSIFRQDCSKMETDSTLSLFALHQDNTEQSIGEPDSDLGFTSLGYNTLLDGTDPRTSVFRFNKLPQSPSLQSIEASEPALHLHLRQVSRTSPKPVVRNTTDFSKLDDIINNKDGAHSEVALLPFTQPPNTPRTDLSPTIDPRLPELVLVDADLWSKFHEQGNEMIITKSGRCLFPCLRFKAVNLDPTAIYAIYLDFELTDCRRFKFEGGRWRASSASTRTGGDPGGLAVALAKESYTHPDMYQIGAHWMKGTIFFDKTKLSNSRESAAKSARKASSSKSAVGNSHHIFHMSSFHKYRPRVHLVQHAAHSDTVASSTTYTFHQTTFIAVTHYQNSKVNDLKKGFNPHARGFRSSAGMSLSFPLATEQKPSCSALQSKRTPTLKRRYSERDTSESDADAYADVNAEAAETDQSSDNDDDDDLDSDVSTLPGMARTSSSEASAKSSKSLCRVNKDNCAMVSISISKGMIEAKRVEGESSQRQQSKRLQRKIPTNLCDSHSSRTRTSHAQLHLKSIHATSATSTPEANKANRKQRIYNTRRFDTSSSSAQSSSSASTKCSSICSITSNPGRAQGQAPQKIEPECDIQEKFAQLSASHSAPSHMEQYQHDAQHGPVVSPLHHDPPTAPPLSWYQRLVYSDQPSQPLSHQTIQRPVLPTTAQNSEPKSCLMHPFTMDNNLDYGMLHGPQQAVPSQALSEAFVDTDASVVQDTRALDTSEVNTPLEPRTAIVKTGARHAHSQVHVQVEEGSTSSQIHSHLTTTFTTILESRTVMSTTSSMAILPSADNSISAHLEHVLRENLRLKAFIRARYGSEAEAEANAVMAMERRQ